MHNIVYMLLLNKVLTPSFRLFYKVQLLTEDLGHFIRNSTYTRPLAPTKKRMKLSRIFKPKKTTKKLVKFVAGDLNSPEIEFNYGKIFEQSDNSIKIATSKNQIELLSDLLNDLEPPFYILYVLIVSRIGQELGRYQSPIFETKRELTEFLNKYRKYFETDARHHIWIGTVENNGLLVYDQHNVIFAYGNIENYRNRLNRNKYKEQNFSFPAPHEHLYHEENDEYEKGILKEFEWVVFPLQESDTYDE